MEPLKSLIPFAKWLLRLTVALLVYAVYFEVLTDPDLAAVTWYISVFISIFAVLLVAGGFVKKPSLTVVSGLIIFILSIIMIFINDADLNSIVKNVAPAVIGFYFLAGGNKG